MRRRQHEARPHSDQADPVERTEIDLDCASLNAYKRHQDPVTERWAKRHHAIGPSCFVRASTDGLISPVVVLHMARDNRDQFCVGRDSLGRQPVPCQSHSLIRSVGLRKNPVMADTKMTKSVGEHWTCATLARHGWAPALTRDGMERTDILAVATHLQARPP